MSFMNVIPGALAGGAGPAPAPSNDYEAELTALGADHYWDLSETTGDFVDALGNWDLTPDTDNVHRGIVGPFRGLPRVHSFAQSVNASIMNKSVGVSERLTGTVGAIGGFIGSNTAVSNTEEKVLLEGVFNNNNGLSWRLHLTMEGHVVMRLSATSTLSFYAEWVWNSASIANSWKEQSGDTYISGNKMAWICVVQRADGNGALLSVNGATPVAADSTTFGARGDDDSWMDELYSEVPSPTSFEVRTKANANWIAGPFVFDGTALTDQQIADIYAAANLTGNVGDYAEYIYALDPDLWKPPTRAGGPGTLTRSWWNKNIENISAWRNSQPLQPAERWVGANRNPSPWPTADLPGMGYNMDGVTTDTSGFNQIGVREADENFSDEWTAANGFDEGAIGLLFEMPNTTQTRIAFGFRTQSGGGEIRIGVASSFVRYEWRKGSTSNRLIINLDKPVAAGELMLLIYQQTGSQIDTYVNGVLRDGGDIGTTITGTASGSDWIHSLRAIQRWRFAVGHRGSSPTTDRFGAPIYDAWITRKILTAAQIKDMWDLVAGNISSATPP